MEGSAVATSGYSPGVRNIFELAAYADRHLLTFENAGYYMDPVWDTIRMNNITQHFATAFLANTFGMTRRWIPT